MKKMICILCVGLALESSFIFAQDEYSFPAPVQGTRTGSLIPVLGAGLVAAGVAAAIAAASIRSHSGGDGHSTHS